MILLLRKRRLGFMFTGLLFLGMSIGVFRLAIHPEMSQWKAQKLLITRVQTSDKVVALTFDDGPDPERTPVVLDKLRKYKVHATFFVMGRRAEQQAKLLQQMVAEGHEIGNHSYSHADFRNKSRSSLKDEIQRCNQTITRITAKKTTLFRPPGGFLSKDLVDLSHEEGMTVAYWSYQTDSKDWVNGKSAASIAQHVIRNIKPGQIILLHDGCPNGMQTAQAVTIILEDLKKQGYRFVTMSELMKLEKKE